jgi:hypothetical protein
MSYIPHIVTRDWQKSVMSSKSSDHERNLLGLRRMPQCFPGRLYQPKKRYMFVPRDVAYLDPVHSQPLISEPDIGLALPRDLIRAISTEEQPDRIDLATVRMYLLSAQR